MPTVSRAASPTLPTVGARPLRPSVTTAGAQHRAGGPSQTAPAATDRDVSGPVAAHWSAGDALPATITSLSASPSSSDELPVQLSPATPGPSTASPQPATSHDATTIVFPPRDGGPSDGGLPTWASSGLSGPAAPGPTASAVARASARPATGHSQPPLTLARSIAAPAPAPVVAPSPSAPVVARIVADPSTPGAPPVVQTSPAGRGIPVATFTATPVVQREEAAAPTPASAGNGHSDRELDELAKALFGRIRTQLKSEVIHEREAKGLSFDAF